MKKGILYLMIGLLFCGLTGCNKESDQPTNEELQAILGIEDSEWPQLYQQMMEDSADNLPSDTAQPPVTQPDDGIQADVNLSALSQTMCYAELYNMYVKPDDYKGKSVKITGTFSTYCDPETEQTYYSVIILDATACCSLGLEAHFTEQFLKEVGVPLDSQVVTVYGTFQTYWEEETQYCYLEDARLAD